VAIDSAPTLRLETADLLHLVAAPFSGVPEMRRRNVIAALAQSGLPRARQIVKAATHDPDEAISRTARLAYSMFLS